MNQKGLAKIILIIVIIILAGVVGYFVLVHKPEAPPVAPSPPSDGTAVREIVIGFLKAKQSRNFENAKPFFSSDFAETIDPVEFAGTSNPHTGRFEVKDVKLLPDGETYQISARVYQEYTGEGDIGYNDNQYYVKFFGDNYLIYDIKYGQYIELPAPPKIVKPKELDYKEMLGQIFPEKKLIQTKNREDCFYDEEQTGTYETYNEVTYRWTFIYCISNIVENFFLNQTKKDLLLIVRSGDGKVRADDILLVPSEEEQPTYAHAAGIYHAFLAVFDIKGEKLLTETLGLIADEGTFSFYHCKKKGKTYILFTGNGGYQGAMWGKAELFEIENKEFNEILSLEEDVLWPKEENVLAGYVYHRKGYPFECPTKCFWGGPTPVPLSGGREFQAWVYSYDLAWNENTCEFEERIVYEPE